MRLAVKLAVLSGVLTLLASFVYWEWQRGAQVVFSWPWIAAGAMLLMACGLKSAFCDKRACSGEERRRWYSGS